MSRRGSGPPSRETTSEIDVKSNDSKIDYLMQMRDDVDRRLAQAALDAVDGDLELAANDLLEGGGWATDEVADNDLAKQSFKKSGHDVDQAAGLSLSQEDVLKHADSTSSADEESESTDDEKEQVTIETFLREQKIPEEHFKVFESEGFAFVEDLVEADGDSIASLFEKLDLKSHVKTRLQKRVEAFKRAKGRRSSKVEKTTIGKTSAKARSGKVGKPRGGKPVWEYDEDPRDDEPLCSDEEDGLLAEALQLSIEELAEGGGLETEDKAAEVNQKWHELANVQKLLRMFGHELSTQELEKLQAEEDQLRDFLDLDPLPRRAEHQTKSMLPSGKGGSHSGKGAKNKVKQPSTPSAEESDETASLRLAEQLEAQDQKATPGLTVLTEAEQRTTMQVVQEFDLNIEEVYHVQTQLKQATGSAFTDPAGLVDAVVNYVETMEDAELARCLQEAERAQPLQSQQQQEEGPGIRHNSSDSESSDEEARIKRRRGRMKKKRADQQYRLPGAAAFKDHSAEGAFLRSVQHEELYEIVEEDSWQKHVKRTAESYLLRPIYMEYLYVEFVCKYLCVF